MTVRIVSDTACDLPDQLVDQYSIGLVPLHVRFGTTEFLDRKELDSKEFWSRCAAQDELPKTAAPSPGAFQEAFEAMASEGASGVVCVTLSAKLSATNEAANQAARAVGPGFTVEVVDSLSVTMGEGIVVLAAAEAAAGGAALEAVAAQARAATSRLSVFGALATLENLKKGGRIGGAAAALGTLLAIKPVIEVRDGAVEQESKQRTRAKSLQYLVDKAKAAAPFERLAVMGADADDFDDFVALLADIPSRHPAFVGEIGPVVATHAGRGTIGVAWLTPSVG